MTPCCVGVFVVRPLDGVACASKPVAVAAGDRRALSRRVEPALRTFQAKRSSASNANARERDER